MANLLNETPPAFYNTTQRCSGGDFHRGQYNDGTWPSTGSLPGSGPRSPGL